VSITQQVVDVYLTGVSQDVTISVGQPIRASAIVDRVALLTDFYKLTGCPVLANTSFNVRDEPIVCTPEHAYLCFMRTNMDYLILGNLLLEKKEQKPLDKDIDWLKEFELD
jgi:predicted NodU family carbamoyl transferase